MGTPIRSRRHASAVYEGCHDHGPPFVGTSWLIGLIWFGVEVGTRPNRNLSVIGGDRDGSVLVSLPTALFEVICLGRLFKGKIRLFLRVSGL